MINIRVYTAATIAFFGLIAAAPPWAQCRETGWVPLEKGAPVTGRKLSAVAPAPKSAIKAAPASKKSLGAVTPDPLPEGVSVYDGQPSVMEAELYEFLDLLPKFRAWARKNGEEAHPMINKKGKPDFLYSRGAAQWVADNGFAPARFFCVMGRMAAALVIVEEGNDDAAGRPADMPSVDSKELSLARKHLGELLSAGGPPGPIK